MTALAVPPRPRIVFRDPIYLGTAAEIITPTLRRLPVLDLPWLAETPAVTVPVLMGRNGRPRGACTLPGYRAGHRGPAVTRVSARSSESAAREAKVPAGGHALVFAESQGMRFDRAKEAPLVQKELDGNPLMEEAQSND